MRRLLASVAAVAMLLGSVAATAMPDEDDKTFAHEVNDALRDSILTLLSDRFAVTNVGNVPIGNAHLRLVFDDDIFQYRLVGIFNPLGGKNSRPRDLFERAALGKALLTGDGVGEDEPVVRRGPRGRLYSRRFIPLSNSDASCSLCHTNFASPPDGKNVGGLAINVPITPTH